MDRHSLTSDPQPPLSHRYVAGVLKDGKSQSTAMLITNTAINTASHCCPLQESCTCAHCRPLSNSGPVCSIWTRQPPAGGEVLQTPAQTGTQLRARERRRDLSRSGLLAGTPEPVGV